MGVNKVLVRAESLKKHYPSGQSALMMSDSHVVAVDGVSFEIPKRSALGLVGESGSGKTTLGYLLLRLIEPTNGKVYFEKQDIFRLNKKQLQELRPRMQIVFQDPDSSLNPRRTIEQTLSEPLVVHKLCTAEEARLRSKEILESVGLEIMHLHRYPHELSGGQRQRVAIARALITNPEFVVFDEPTSALDVSMQAKILELIQKLREELEFTYLFISHDLSVVRHICDQIMVMYLGEIVEIASAKDLFRNPIHPYTQALVNSLPRPDPHHRRLIENITILGEPPSRIQRPQACRFHPRCPYNDNDRCVREEPPLREISAERYSACHYAEQFTADK